MKNIQLLSFLAVAFFSLTTQADRLSGENPYYPTAFYADVNAGVKDGALKEKVHKILASAHIKTSGNDEIAPNCSGQKNCSMHTPLSYRAAREFLLGKMDLLEGQNGYALKDVYCQTIFTEKDFKRGQGPQPDHVPDHTVFNVEHTWPQSRFSGAFPGHYQKGDLYILYGSSTIANSSRQNLQFADVQTEQSPVCPAVRRGWIRGNSGEVFFEPPDDHKGNVARSLFYFSTRYKLRISATEEEAIRRWHKLDPVDERERERMEEIFKVQSVRNPFIDHPELADLISDF